MFIHQAQNVTSGNMHSTFALTDSTTNLCSDTVFQVTFQSVVSSFYHQEQQV